MRRFLLNPLRAIDKAIYLLEVGIVSCSLLTMVTLYFIQAVQRNLWGGGDLAFQLISQHLVLWVGMMGASLCVRERKHIAIEVLAKNVSPSGQRVVESLVDLSTLVICVVLAVVAWGYIDFIERPENKVLFTLGEFPIRRWWSICVLPAGFSIMAFRYGKLVLERIFVDEPVDAAAHILEEINDYERRHSSDEWRALTASRGDATSAEQGEAAP